MRLGPTRRMDIVEGGDDGVEVRESGSRLVCGPRASSAGLSSDAVDSHTLSGAAALRSPSTFIALMSAAEPPFPSPAASRRAANPFTARPRAPPLSRRFGMLVCGTYGGRRRAQGGQRAVEMAGQCG
jgi:hypothetical protein